MNLTKIYTINVHLKRFFLFVLWILADSRNDLGTLTESGSVLCSLADSVDFLSGSQGMADGIHT